MLKTATHNVVSFDSGNRLSLDIRSDQITVSDSIGGDSVTITGLTDAAIKHEISYFVRLQRWSHDKERRAEAMQCLTALAQVCKEGIAQLNTCETVA